MAWKLVTTLFFCLTSPNFATALPEQQSCANIKNNFGYTSPPGDIFLNYGRDSLDLDCIITNPKILRSHPDASKDLHFYIGNDVVNGSYIVDESRIHLHVDKDDLRMGPAKTYSCMWNGNIICDNVVFVGTKPQPKNFRCVSYNNDNFTCLWSHPNSSIQNIYNLSFTVKLQPQKKMECPKIEMDDSVRSDEDRYKCVWTLTTNPQYRQSSDYYNISFTATNPLGNYSEYMPRFNHFANIIPNAPERLQVLNRTTSSLFLLWGIPPTIQHRMLQYRVMYLCGRDKDRVFKQAALKTFSDLSKAYFNLTGLTHAHDLCDIRVSLRINLTRDENMWSQNATLYEWTAPTVPGEGPKVNIGSFKHINDTAVRIYWQKVPEEFENGENLQYNVTLLRGAPTVVIDRARPMKNSAVIGNLSSNQNYTFAVYAKNDEGPQVTPHAYITIPARDQRPYQVRELKKIENTKGFKLQWQRRLPDNQIEIVNYTVFWCREKTKSFNEDCNGNWEWATVSSKQEQYIYEESSEEINSTSFRVAIASNSEYSSSGMVFPTCEESGEQIPSVNLIKPTNFGDTWVKLSWMVKCTTEVIANYTIEYCIADRTSYDCRNKPDSVHVDGSYTDFNIGNLTAYETYIFTIYPTMKNGNKGKTSDPERVATLEGKPTQPLNLRAMNITNSSISLNWTRPDTFNGLIVYKVVSNDVEVSPSIKETSFVLDNLRSYGLYNISVEACTTQKCSDKSNILSVRTRMGVPGRVPQPTARSINTSDVMIVWGKPEETRGPVTYQIRVDDGQVNMYTKITEQYHYRCAQSSSTYSVTIRAVNHDEEKNETYYGDWSDEFKGNCSPSMGWLIPVLVVILVTMIGTAYFSKRLYTRCKKMQDIEVKLPSAFIVNDPQVWASQKDTTAREAKPTAAADEELLLQSRPEGIKASYVGDSSGCSSAQGSVTSESEGTFSAASDSGTEQSELRKRSFRNSSKTSLLGSDSGGSGSSGKNENYSQVGVGMGLSLGLNLGNIGIEANPLADMDDVNPKPALCTYMQPYVDAENVTRPVDVPSSAYVTVAQARSLPKPKEEPVSKPYVQVSDLKSVAQKREPPVDSNRSYVTVGQMPPAAKMNKLYDAKLLKED